MANKHHKLFWGSSYDRGLDILLFMWDDIKKAYPDAELHICYGWDLFDKVAHTNPERMQWKENVEKLMHQEGVFHYGRIGKQLMKELRQQCGIWAYPTYFTEINCITALECQNDGLVPVTMTLAALSETAKEGILIDGSITKLEVKDKFQEELLGLMSDKDRWELLSKKCKKFAKDYDWSRIASKWVKEFNTPVNQPLVSIITPTIRQGFWHLMRHNIDSQTYKNIEWIVVDDYPEDRSEIANKYGAIYLRGKENNTRFYGLSSANNIGWKEAKGELCVWLQDFVLMPETGIEDLVDIYRHSPNALIAPVDVYHQPKIKPDTDSEDWFKGETDVIGQFMRKNVRVQNRGIVESKIDTDFEMNYGAIPRHILEHLNGFWEFYDEALGWDNTEIAYRAMKMGYKLLIDDTNVAVCLDHWEALKDKPEQLGKERTIRLNDPRYVWMVKRMREGKLPIIRDEEIDNQIELKYSIPSDLAQDKAVDWMLSHMKEIQESWKGVL